jgi:Zn-dependent protease
MPQILPGLGMYHYWIMGIFGAIILFISVLIHELAHSIISLKYGIKVHQIMLFIFGGVSDIRDEPKDSGKEFKIAIVGPLASFVIAGLFSVVLWGLLQFGGDAAAPTLIGIGGNGEIIPPGVEQFTTPQAIIIRILSGVAIYGSIVNILLGLFNLLPAFPLDGGRILRALVYRWKNNYDYATRIAVKVGTGISYGLMGFGFINILTGSFIGGFWLILIGWFLQSGAQAYLQQHELSNSLSKVRLRDVMKAVFTSVGPNISVKELLDDFFNVYRKSEFPVTDPENGILLGSVTAKQAMNVSQDALSDIKVRDVMYPVNSLVIMHQDDHAYEALNKMYRGNKSRVFVCSAVYPKIYKSLNAASDNQEYIRNLAKA